MRNPAFSEDQRVMSCMDLKRLKEGKKTRTGMKKKDLKDFCRKPVVPKSERKGKWMQKVRKYRKARDKEKKHRRHRNPHLTSGKWRYVGMFMKHDVPEVKRIFRIHGIANKVTKDHLKHNKRLREIYVRREQFDTAYRAVTRLFEGGQAA